MYARVAEAIIVHVTLHNTLHDESSRKLRFTYRFSSMCTAVADFVMGLSLWPPQGAMRSTDGLHFVCS